MEYIVEERGKRREWTALALTRDASARMSPYEEFLSVISTDYPEHEVFTVQIIPVKPPLLPVPRAQFYTTGSSWSPGSVDLKIIETGVSTWWKFRLIRCCGVKFLHSTPLELANDELVAMPPDIAERVTRITSNLTASDLTIIELNSLEFPLGFVLERAAPDLFQQLTTGYQQLAERACKEWYVCETPPGGLFKGLGDKFEHYRESYSSYRLPILYLYSVGGPHVSTRELEEELRKLEGKYNALRAEYEGRLRPIRRLVGFQTLTDLSRYLDMRLAPAIYRNWPEAKRKLRLAVRVVLGRLAVELLERWLEAVEARGFTRPVNELEMLDNNVWLTIFELGRAMLGYKSAVDGAPWLVSLAEESLLVLRDVYGLGLKTWRVDGGLRFEIELPGGESAQAGLSRAEFANLIFFDRPSYFTSSVFGSFFETLLRLLSFELSNMLEGMPGGLALRVHFNRHVGPLVAARRGEYLTVYKPFKYGPAKSVHELGRGLYRMGVPGPTAAFIAALAAHLTRHPDIVTLVPLGFTRYGLLGMIDAVERDNTAALLAETVDGGYAVIVARPVFSEDYELVGREVLYMERGESEHETLSKVNEDLSTPSARIPPEIALILAKLLRTLGVKPRLHFTYWLAANSGFMDDFTVTLPGTLRPARVWSTALIIPDASVIRMEREDLEVFEIDDEGSEDIADKVLSVFGVEDPFPGSRLDKRLTFLRRVLTRHIKRVKRVYITRGRTWVFIEFRDGTAIGLLVRE